MGWDESRRTPLRESSSRPADLTAGGTDSVLLAVIGASVASLDFFAGVGAPDWAMPDLLAVAIVGLGLAVCGAIMNLH